MRYGVMRKALYLLCVTAVSLIGLAGCEDYITTSSAPATESGGVPVTVSIGFADEADDNVYEPGTRSTAHEAFTVERGTVRTRGVVADAPKPDKLYYLEVQQYDAGGTLLQNNILVDKALNPGSQLTLTLTPTSGEEYCQLLIVARGSGQAVPTLQGKSLSSVQSDVSVASSTINAIENTADGIKAMPYVLHLKKVKVVQEAGGAYKIQSPDGAHDVRLMLQRLAARLTVTWNYSVADYKLKQLLIQSVPLNYTVADKPETDGTYPSIVSQFTILEVSIAEADAAHGSYSCWMPANVRGESAAATTDAQRTKANAPVGSTFLNFVAVNTGDTKKKLDYRVYTGSGSSMDFNMYRNMNYVYGVNFAHSGIPTNDNRVTYIDPIPASENNDNLVPTANCFMVEPGGAFCFDPFAYQQKGQSISNTTLKSWCSSTSGIKSVRVLWQTRENGDVGDPILGIANSPDDHTNMVDIKNADGTTFTGPAYDINQCRIYCRVASNTTGGNGAIVAYDGENGTGNILWSWHLWVTDYLPEPSGNSQILSPVNKRKLRFTYGNPTVLPVMDRNLGAMAGYVDAPPTSYRDMSKANGLHYQWGRKDPFPSSYTEKEIEKIDNKNSSTPPEGMQNRYGADGITYVVNDGKMVVTTLRGVCQTPTVFYAKEGTGSYAGMGVGPDWTSEMGSATWGTTKTVWDPCPAGWRVASRAEMSAVVYSGKNVKNDATKSKDGGYLVYYEALGSGHSSYFRFTGYGRYFDTFVSIGSLCTVWSCTSQSNTNGFVAARLDITTGDFLSTSMYKSDAHTIRCIQEQD